MVWRSNLACVFAHACRARLHVWDVSWTLLGSFLETSWKLPGKFAAHLQIPTIGFAHVQHVCCHMCSACVCQTPRDPVVQFSRNRGARYVMLTLLHPPVDPSAHGRGQCMEGGRARCVSRGGRVAAQAGMFSSTARCFLKVTWSRCLVKMSAAFAELLTYTTLISPRSTSSRMKRSRRRMCRVL